MLSVVWGKVNVSYHVEHGKATDLLLSVVIKLYNIHPEPYLPSVILLLSEVACCLLAVLRVLCQISFSAM